MKEIPLQTFLYQFCQNERPDKKYCFILGSGASRPSGIPTGGELVKKWMAELAEMYDSETLDTWKSAESIDMDDLAKDYSKIFDKRFELDEKEGFSFLEKIMEGKEPSCGYSVLAQILEQEPQNIVITTNFDSLTEDALFIYTQKKPLVVGHEALAHYIKPFGTRPIIVKIHRDLYLTPKNTEHETSKLETSFKKNLTNIFKYYTPLVIGYGGNDGSLMGFLEELDEIEGHIFWFYRRNDGGLTPRIIALLEKFNGFAVPIPGFDDLMIQIGNKLKLERLDEKVEQIAKQRAKNYREQIEKITEEKTTPKETKDAVGSIVERGGKDWWFYEVEASKEDDFEKRDEIYQEGIKQCPQSAELHGNYALFLEEIRKDYDQAEVNYQKAIKLAPEDAYILGNYALFLSDIRQDYDQAEAYYKKAFELAPDIASFKVNYANFLKNICKDYDQSEAYYQRAIELAPEDANILGNYALFLEEVRKDYDQSEVFYQKAIGSDPEHANTTGNYAVFLQNIRKDYDQAEAYYKKTIELVPDGACFKGNYANFLSVIRKDYDQAEAYYQKALELNPKNTIDLSNYANFLSDIRKDYDQAKEFYQKALELDPGNANNIGNFAKHLIARKEIKKAYDLIQKAFELNQDKRKDLELELWFYRYAIFFNDYKEALQNIEALLEQGITSPGWYLDDVLAVAKELGHSDYKKLSELAKKITEP